MEFVFYTIKFENMILIDDIYLDETSLNLSSTSMDKYIKVTRENVIYANIFYYNIQQIQDLAPSKPNYTGFL